MGMETAASGMASVYQNGGNFYVDIDDGRITNPAGTSITGVVANGATTTPATSLYVHATVAGQMNSTGTGNPIAIVVEPAAALASGIPGEYVPDGATYATSNTTDLPRQFVKIKLLI